MADEKNREDLFDDTRMSFGSHIEELRAVLMKALIGVGVGMAFGLYFGPYVVTFLQEPLVKAIKDFQEKRAKTEYREKYGFIPPYVKSAIEEQHMTPKSLSIESNRLASAISQATGSSKVVAEEDQLIGLQESQLSVERLKEFCQRLVEKESPKIQAVRNLFSQQELDRLKEIVAGETPSESQRDEVVAMINRYLSDSQLRTSDAFAEQIAGDEDLTIQMEFVDLRLKAGDSKPNEIRSLNQYLLVGPFEDLLENPTMNMVQLEVWEPIIERAQSLGIQEPFMVWLKAGFFTGMAIASPWIFMQIWSFVAGGLYPHEKKYVYLYMPFSLILFILGALFAFYIVFKYVLDFLFTFNAQMGIEPDPRIGEYLGFVMMLPLGFGVAFQLPLVMLFLHRIGLISIRMYLSKWRIAVLVICVISMIFTPTDPISMLLMAFPLIGLYFFGVLLCKWMPQGRNPFSEAYDPA